MVKRTQRARVWVQYFLSVMNQAIINRLNVKLHLCYEKKGGSFPPPEFRVFTHEGPYSRFP